MKINLQRVWVQDEVATELHLVNEEGAIVAHIEVTAYPPSGNARQDMKRMHGAQSITWIPGWPQDEWERIMHMIAHMPLVLEYMRGAMHDPDWRLAYDAGMEQHQAMLKSMEELHRA